MRTATMHEDDWVPSIAFLLAIGVFGEHLNATRLASFGLIWLSLVIYTADSMIRRRRAT